MAAPVQIVRPDPDPTLLTTENLRREIANLKELLEAKLSGNHELILSEIRVLTGITEERFTGVAAQFSERDTRTDQRAGDTKLAVDAAFAAAKEATAKIEAGFTKQIDAMISIIDTKTGNLASGLADLKERIVAMESRTQGITTANQDNRQSVVDNRGLIFGIFGTIVGVFAAAVAVIGHVR